MFPIIPHLLSFTPMPPTQLRDLEREVFGGSDSEFSDDDDDNDGPPLLFPLTLAHPFQTSSSSQLPSNPHPGLHTNNPLSPLAPTLMTTMSMRNAQESQISSLKARQSAPQMIGPFSASASEKPLSILTLTTFLLNKVRSLYM